MESFAAVGLAANILEFIRFGQDLVTTVNELRENSHTGEHLDYVAITKSLKLTSEALSHSRTLTTSGDGLDAEQSSLLDVADGCTALSTKLLTKLEEGPPGTQRSKMKTFKAAFRTVWSKRETDEIMKRLQYYRSQIVLLELVSTRSRISDFVSNGGFETIKSDVSRHSEVLHELTELVKQGPQDALEDFLAKSQHQSEQLMEENRSMRSELGCRIQDSTKILLESISSATIQGPHYNVQTIQKAGATNELAQNLFRLLQPSWNDFSTSVVAQVSQGVRATIRNEMDSIQDSLRNTALDAADPSRLSYIPQSLPGTLFQDKYVQQHSVQTSPPAHQRTMAAEGLSYEHTIFDRDNRGPTKVRLDSSCFFKTTRVGIFTFTTESVRDFTTGEKIVSIRVTFLPSRWLCSVGVILSYNHIIDPRGYPSICPSIKFFAVIPRDHPAFQCIGSGTIQEFRRMLDAGEVGPSDRAEDGYSLLHCAAICQELLFCEALIIRGGDITAVNSLGFCPIHTLICSSGMFTKSYDTFLSLVTLLHGRSIVDPPASEIGERIAAFLRVLAQKKYKILRTTSIDKRTSKNDDDTAIGSGSTRMLELSYTVQIGDTQLPIYFDDVARKYTFARKELEMTDWQLDTVLLLVDAGLRVAPKDLCFLHINAIIQSGAPVNTHEWDGSYLIAILQVYLNWFLDLDTDEDTNEDTDEDTDEDTEEDTDTAAEGDTEKDTCKVWLSSVLAMLISVGVDPFQRHNSGSYKESSVTEIFRSFEIPLLVEIWEDALTLAGIDLNLFYEEDAKFADSVPANSSAHDFESRSNVAAIVERSKMVSRRRPFQAGE